MDFKNDFDFIVQKVEEGFRGEGRYCTNEVLMLHYLL